MTTTREIHLRSRPHGLPTAENFETVEVELPEPGPGQVLVRNTFMSVDPYMRPRMNDAKSYVAPFELGAPLDGGAVGEVVASNLDSLQTGDTVQHGLGWREHALLGADQVRKIDASRVPASAYLGALGMPAMTAYVGLTRIAEMREGDAVLVSGAAGAVGSMAGQMARLLGASKVVGSAGSAEKVAWVTEELGFDACVDYHDGKISQLIRPHGPFDVYFDNVGADHLEAAIGSMSDFGRIAACGTITGYNATEVPPGPRNLFMLVQKRLTLRGFIVSDHADVAGEFYRTVGGWLADGSLVYRETVLDGIDNAVEAFLGLYRGDNIGKMLVRLA